MGEVLGLGLTHFPPLGWPDEAMDRALQFALADPNVPDAVKGGEGWPDGMREEFDRDRLAAAADHRAALVAGCDRVRAALDEFAPDVVVIWGDDQYELFREDVVPAFCVVAAESLTFSPWRGSTGAVIPNIWEEDVDTQFELRGHAAFATSPRRSCTTSSTSPTRTPRVRTGRSRTPSRTRCCSSTTTAWASRTRSCR
jgi:hypothetical protein